MSKTAFRLTALACVAALGVSVAVAPTPARADNAGAFVGGLVGGVILKTIIDSAHPGYRPQGHRPVRAYRAPVDPAVTEYWRGVQVTLNEAGFYAGRPDGVPGRRTRAAVRDFQISIGAEPTGQLTPSEYNLLRNQVARATMPAPVAPMQAMPVVASAASATGQRDPWEGEYLTDCRNDRLQCWWEITREGDTPSYRAIYRMADRLDRTNVRCQMWAIADHDTLEPNRLMAMVPGAGIVWFKTTSQGQLDVAQGQALGCDGGTMSGLAEPVGD